MHACTLAISARGSGSAPRVLEQQNQLPFMCRCRLETKTSIESLGNSVDRVCQQSPDTRLISNRDRSTDSVLQHTKAKPLSLVVKIDRMTRQNDQRNRIYVGNAISNKVK